MRSITPRELKERIDRGDALLLLDVREPSEAARCRLASSLLIPINDIPRRLDELDPERETVVYCHHGIRSSHAIAHLEAQGFIRLLNLRGGIDAWSREVEPRMPRY